MMANCIINTKEVFEKLNRKIVKHKGKIDRKLWNELTEEEKQEIIRRLTGE